MAINDMNLLGDMGEWFPFSSFNPISLWALYVIANAYVPIGGHPGPPIGMIRPAGNGLSVEQLDPIRL